MDAVYHDEIRIQLLARASNNGQDFYTYGRDSGVGQHDQTAFLESQRHWGSVYQQQWPELLYRFRRNNYKGPDYPVGNMHYNGLLVLDGDNHPIRDFVDIPSTLSSAVEDWLL